MIKDIFMAVKPKEQIVLRFFHFTHLFFPFMPQYFIVSLTHDVFVILRNNMKQSMYQMKKNKFLHLRNKRNIRKIKGRKG